MVGALLPAHRISRATPAFMFEAPCSQPPSFVHPRTRPNDTNLSPLPQSDFCPLHRAFALYAYGGRQSGYKQPKNSLRHKQDHHGRGASGSITSFTLFSAVANAALSISMPVQVKPKPACNPATSVVPDPIMGSSKVPPFGHSAWM